MEQLKQRFSRLYPGATLYAIQLDGFSHKVFWKDETGRRHIDGYSAYASQYHPSELCEDGAIRSFNEDKTKALFIGYAHYCYQGNAKEYVYEPVSEWNKNTSNIINQNQKRSQAQAQ